MTRQNVSRYFNQRMQIYKISILIFCREYLFYFCENTWLLAVEKVVVEWHCLRVRYRTPRLRVRDRTSSHAYEDCLGVRLFVKQLLDESRDTGCVSVPARICSNSYFTNKNSCWSFTLLRPPSLIICIYCYNIQTSISLYKRYKIYNGQEWKKHN